MTELEKYQEYVKNKLEALKPVFAKAAVGDFSSEVTIPEEDDEFTEFYVGIQIMLEVINDQLRELKNINVSLEERINERTEKLRKRTEELETMNKFMIDREVRMSEMKREFEELKAKLGE